MNIDEAIKELIRVRDMYKKTQDEIKVYIDCPKCGISFEPTSIVAQAIHVKAEK